MEPSATQAHIAITWAEVRAAAAEVADQIRRASLASMLIAGIPRGGLFAAAALVQADPHFHIVGLPPPYAVNGVIIIDDICDRSHTLRPYILSGRVMTASLFLRASAELYPSFYGTKLQHDLWLDFPWE